MSLKLPSPTELFHKNAGDSPKHIVVNILLETKGLKNSEDRKIAFASEVNYKGFKEFFLNTKDQEDGEEEATEKFEVT